MMRRGSGLVLAISFGLGSLSLGGVGCDEADPTLKQWTVEDHKHRTERRTRREKDRKRNHSRPQKSNQLASVTWETQCASCHGSKGKGDGPEARVTKPKDLTSRQWQASVTNEQLAQSIVRGKGQMPAYNLPVSTVVSLVDYIRAMRKRTREERVQERAARRSRSSRKKAKKGAVGTVSGALLGPAQPALTAPPAPAAGKR